MFFNNALVYQFTRNLFPDGFDSLEKNLKEFEFKEPGEQDFNKQGWVSPLPCGELFTHIADGRVLIALKEEHKVLPADVIKKKLNARVEEIELAQGRKLRKKEKDALKEDILVQLLPRCFTKDSKTYAYISPKNNTLIVNTASTKTAENLISFFRKTIGSLPVVPLQTKNQLDVLMTNWLVEQVHPAPFEVTENAKLVSAIEGGGKATFKDQALFSDEVLNHVNADKFVTEIGLKTDELSFTLTEQLQLKGIKFADVLQEQNEDLDKDDLAARFDADFALMAGTLDEMLKKLFPVLSVVELEA